jgi:hypothetical protein
MVTRSVISCVGLCAPAVVAIAMLGGCTFLVSNQTKTGPGSPIPCADVCGNDVQCQAGCADAPPATGYVH